MNSPTLRASGIAVFIGLIGASPIRAADPIPWRTDYTAARKEAEAKKLPLLVVIGSQDCFYCRKLESHTFTDRDIVAFLNAKFIPLKIDATKEPEFAKGSGRRLGSGTPRSNTKGRGIRRLARWVNS